MDKLGRLIQKFRDDGGSVIGLLQDISEEYRYLPEEALQRVSDETGVPLSRLYGLATFYTSFRLEPMGKHHVCVCVGTACHVNGAEKIAECVCRELGVEPGGTTEDQEFTVETVNCLGACALGPLVTVNGEYHSKVDQAKAKKLLKQYKE
jgi:NADH-quinone oxidoreductase subunit E